MRSVVEKPLLRCSDCMVPPRWCVCPVAETIHTPVQIDLLSHPRELHRPSSTGNLIKRSIHGTKQISWVKGASPETQLPNAGNRELLILHPHGKPLAPQNDLDKLHFLLLDGYWNEAKAMSNGLRAEANFVSLPMTGPSRYWLRGKQDGERYSTAEAVIFLLQSLGLNTEAEKLRVQFELQVYSGLRSRGRKTLAEEYLQDSILLKIVPDFIDQLNSRRPRHEGD